MMEAIKRGTLKVYHQGANAPYLTVDAFAEPDDPNWIKLRGTNSLDRQADIPNYNNTGKPAVISIGIGDTAMVIAETTFPG